MKIVKVTYTAKAGYVEQNKVNIQKVMADLQTLNNPNINYNSCLGADGQTFIHTAFYRSEEDQQLMTSMESFQYFQQQLKAHGLETPPIQELLQLVGTSMEIFGR